MFRNNMDKVHLLGGFLIGVVVFLHLLFPEFFMWFDYLLTIILLMSSSFLWELWDRYKVLHYDKRAESWSKFTKLLFTSDGYFDKVDFGLSFVGTVLGLAISSIIAKILGF